MERRLCAGEHASQFGCSSHDYRWKQRTAACAVFMKSLALTKQGAGDASMRMLQSNIILTSLRISAISVLLRATAPQVGRLTLQRINELEVAVLKALQYNVRVDSSCFAR